MKRREKRELKERHFKVNETVYEASKIMDDKTAGKFFKSICDYAFNGKVYAGNDVTIKSNFLLVKRILDGQAKDRAYGKIGAEKSKELRKQRQEEAAIKQVILGCDIAEGIGELLSKLDESDKK